MGSNTKKTKKTTLKNLAEQFRNVNLSKNLRDSTGNANIFKNSERNYHVPSTSQKASLTSSSRKIIVYLKDGIIKTGITGD